MIQHIAELQWADSRRQAIPGFAEDFPYAALEGCMDEYARRQTPWHWHEGVFEFVLVHAGEMDCCTHDGAFTLRAGDGCLINAGVLHVYRAHEGMEGVRYSAQRFEIAAVAGTQRVARQFVEPFAACMEIEALPLRADGNEQERETLQIMQTALQYAADEPAGWEMEISSALARAWRRIWALASPQTRPRKRRRNSMRPENARVKRMIAYMHEHFAEDLKLSAIAGDAGVCATEGLRCFRQEVDVTPIIFLTDVRLRHAALMLRDSELSATQIAAACGFSSVSYFGKVFHRYMDVPPSVYRGE